MRAAVQAFAKRIVGACEIAPGLDVRHETWVADRVLKVVWRAV